MKNKILVVEDNLDIQKIYYSMLSDQYELTHAYDTKQAWRELSRGDFDLIILDIILPKGKFGDKFYMQIRQHPQYMDIPVLFSTVIDDEVEAEAMQNLNNADWMVKPFTKEKLTEKIDGLTRGRA